MAIEIVFTRDFRRDLANQRERFIQYRSFKTFIELSDKILFKSRLLAENPFIGQKTDTEGVQSILVHADFRIVFIDRK